MDATMIIFLLAALALGALLGWLFGSRGAAAGQGVAESLRLQLDAVREERDAHARSIEAQRAEHARAIDTLRGDHATAMERLRADHLDLSSRHAAMVASQEERDRAHQKQLDALETKFAEVGGQMLERAEKKFLERADQRFKESEATSGNNLKALLQPVHERLQTYEETVTKVES